MTLLSVRVAAKRFGADRRAGGPVDEEGGEAPVLRDVRFSLAAGESIGLIGASGCGKSTLLRIVAGLDPDFEGQVLLAGRPVTGPSREIGVVFQEPRLFPWLTVAENVAFDIGKTGSAAQDEAWVRHLVAEVGLSGLEDALPRQLSGGQAQRVAVARALYTRPRLLLLDEPFSALDAFTRTRLQDLVRDLARAHGSSLLLVTHDVEEAVLLADRVLVLGGAPGRVLRELSIPLRAPRVRASAAVADLRRELLLALERAACTDQAALLAGAAEHDDG